MKVLITGAFLFLLLAGAYSCRPGSEPEPVEVQGTTFFYYPRPNIYYDIERKQYYVWDSGKATWDQQRQLSPDLAAILGKRVLLDSVAVPVYKDNAHHRLIYSASLYASPEEMRRKFREDSLNSVPHKAPQTAANPLPAEGEEKEEKRRKTKVGRFLERIFHKPD